MKKLIVLWAMTLMLPIPTFSQRSGDDQRSQQQKRDGERLVGRVYTIYIDTALGTVIMKFADPSSAEHFYAEYPTAPQPLRTQLPAGVRRSRLVIAGVVDRSGQLRNLRVVESTGPEMATKVLAALTDWKFRPALRRDQPIEVNAILGFGIDAGDQHYQRPVLHPTPLISTGRH